VGSTATYAATARDAQGNVLTGRTVAWSSSSATVATVSGGLLSAVSPGTTQIRATVEHIIAEAAVTVIAHPWTTTGSLATGRTLHTATLLSNGKVLVVGGQSVGTPFATFASAELYDPTAGTWSATGALATARANHIAVRLLNGKVLIAGGNSIESSSRLASAEVYDPATGTWSTTGSMASARQQPVAVLLPDGKVLVAGGFGAGADLNALSTAEIYDPAVGTWSATGSMTVARAGHSGELLANGKVLVAGGANGTFASPTLLASAELYDVTARTWTSTGSFSTARGFHRAIALPTGKVLMVGGSNFVSTVFDDADLYDATANNWAPTARMLAARVSHTATLLQNGRVLVAGGGGASVLARVEVYNPTTGTWTELVAMRVARSNHAAVALADGKVLVVGGQGTGAASSAEVFNPALSGSVGGSIRAFTSERVSGIAKTREP
jgi:N-acetylneuraminic acid mutarotase